MSKRTLAKWFAIFIFGAVVVGSLGEHSFAFVPACVALCLLISPIDAKLAKIAKTKKFSAYGKSWFKPVVLISMFLIVGATLPKTQSNPDTTPKPSSNDSKEVIVEATQKPPVYDIPTLLGKTTDELQVILGEPSRSGTVSSHSR